MNAWPANEKDETLPCGLREEFELEPHEPDAFEPPRGHAPHRRNARSLVELRHADELLGADDDALRRGEEHNVESKLAELLVGLSLLSDFAYPPGMIRPGEHHRVARPARIQRWLEQLARRPSAAHELELLQRAA